MMKFFASVAVLTCAIVSTVHGLAVGEFYRPSGDKVSGRVGATTPYVRSPCPAMNTLANHGFLPRDGRNVSHDRLRAALHEVFNIDDGLISVFLSRLPEQLSLSDLSKHNFVEHDASLVHDDVSTGHDPAWLNDDLWHNIVSHAKNNQLGPREMAAVRRDRLDQCKKKTSGCDFGAAQRARAFMEVGLLLRGLGGQNDESISLEFAQSFLMDERIPETFTKPSTPVSFADMLLTAGKTQTLALFQDINDLFD